MTNSRVQEALKTLTEEGYVWKVWSIEDVKDRLLDMRRDDDPALENVPAGEDEKIAERAVNSWYFDMLSRCTDLDWAHIDDAIYESLGD